MITKQEVNPSNSILHTLPPAQLWLGQHEHALQEVQQFLQQKLCPNNGCHTCTTCIQIRDKQHHALMWLYPEKGYTIEQLDGIFNTIAYSLQPGELFFFIIQKADLLSTACANKLLKPMEEPPQGYHFILIAERSEQILPTIISRCIIQKIATKTSSYQSHPIFQAFTAYPCSPAEFSKIIDSNPISEQDSVALFNEIFHYWVMQNKTSSCQDILAILKNMYAYLPMPGGSTLFWRNLYLQIKCIN